MTLRTARGGASAKLPVALALVEDATLLHALLLRVLDYYLYYLDAPKDHAELAAILSGTGYLELADDLPRLRLLPVRGRDRGRQALPTRAPREARDLLRANRPRARPADHRAVAHYVDIAQRAWTLLLESCTEVVLTGQYLFNTATTERFPASLIAGNRRDSRVARMSTSKPSYREPLWATEERSATHLPSVFPKWLGAPLD